MEDSYPTGRADGNLIDDESLAWPWNLESSETFEGENTSETSPEREGGASPFTTGSETPERNDEIDPQNTGESSNQNNPDSREPPSETENVHSVPDETLQSHPELRISTRATKGQYSEDSIRRYMFAAALLGAAKAVTEPFEPKTLSQARADISWKQWFAAMKDENKSLLDNITWTLVNPPPNRRVLQGKWVYKLKRGPNGEILRYKARWVVRGFEQEEGVDYNETFASVVKPMSYKMIFAIAAALDLEIEQMDVKTAFLYGAIDEEIYVEQPIGLEDGTKRVCHPNKALYGLKQSPRIWYRTLALFLKSLGFSPLSSDLGVFAKGHIYLAVYVDDLLIVGPKKSEIQKIKDALSERFQMTDLGPCTYYLGMSVRRDRPTRSLRLHQKGYIEKVLREFNMWECKPVITPMDTNKLEPPKEGFIAIETNRN